LSLLNADRIAFIKSQFGLDDYQIAALQAIHERSRLSGHVLEVGGSNLPRNVVFGDLQAASWTCVDMIDDGRYQVVDNADHYKQITIEPVKNARPAKSGEYIIFDGPIQEANTLPDGHFDAVISITSFEHINDFPVALAQIRRVLKPGGSLVSYHGPIWSSYCGHHAWVTNELNFNTELLPPWSHLLYSPEEMQAFLAEKFDEKIVDEAIRQIYDSPRVNRLFYDDYLRDAENVGFSTCRLEPYSTIEVPTDIEARLKARFGSRCSDFGAYGAILTCVA